MLGHWQPAEGGTGTLSSPQAGRSVAGRRRRDAGTLSPPQTGRSAAQRHNTRGRRDAQARQGAGPLQKVGCPAPPLACLSDWISSSGYPCIGCSLSANSALCFRTCDYSRTTGIREGAMPSCCARLPDRRATDYMPFFYDSRS